MTPPGTVPCTAQPATSPDTTPTHNAFIIPPPRAASGVATRISGARSERQANRHGRGCGGAAAALPLLPREKNFLRALPAPPPPPPPAARRPPPPPPPP